MNRIVVWLFAKTPLGRVLNEKKTYIGAVLLVMSGLLKIVESLLPLFPDLGDVLVVGKEMFDALTSTLDQVGLGFLGLGLAHKEVKREQAKE